MVCLAVDACTSEDEPRHALLGDPPRHLFLVTFSCACLRHALLQPVHG